MGPTLVQALVYFVVVLGATWAGVALVLTVLDRLAILDVPNHRSSHDRPTPTGGGLAVLPVAAAALVWTGIDKAPFPELPALLCGLAVLGAVSWLDDLRSVRAPIRLAVHAVCVFGMLWAVPFPGPVFAGLLPAWGDAIAAGLLWIWFINLYNFMDGIDGITAVETAAIGLGIAVLATLGGTGAQDLYLGLGTAAAAFGFLIWNRHPARIFLGDVGSIPLGFLLGWMLLDFAARGYGAAALALPAYYLADATITIGKRALRGENVLQAHRSHFYQRAAASVGPVAVVRAVALTGAMLVACACAALVSSPAGLAAAAAVAGALLWWMDRKA